MKSVTLLFATGLLVLCLGCGRNQPKEVVNGKPSNAGEANPGANPSDMGQAKNLQFGSSMMNAMSDTDKAFIRIAGRADNAEIELGRLAAQKTSATAANQFGQRMVEDHSKLNQELTAIASKQNVSIPTDLEPKDEKEKNVLSKLSGKRFDREYMKDMALDHKLDIQAFKTQIKNGTDQSLLAWAKKTLPLLQAHLEHAKQISK